MNNAVEFLKSEEFEKYRGLMLEEISNYIVSRLFGKEEDLKELKGAIELSRLIIRLPLKIRKEEFVGKLINDDLIKFKTNLLEKNLINGLAKHEFVTQKRK